MLIAGIVIFSGCLDFLNDEAENRAPQAVAKAMDENSKEGTTFEPEETIWFTGKGSSDPDGDVLEYFWDFDNSDGKEEMVEGDITNSGRTLEPHYYYDKGTYIVTLTVTDGREYSTATVKITIDEPETNIRAVVSTDDETNSKMVGEERVTFTFSATDSVSDSKITKYEWDFSYDSAEGFYADEETTKSETSWDFDSGIYNVKVRITNEMGESDESSYSDDVEIRINYEYTDTRTIGSGQQEHLTQVYGLPARYIRATLEYDAGAAHTSDLDLYLYNASQERNPDQDESTDPDDECDECVAKNSTHDSSQREQANRIVLDYYNSTDRAWFDEVNELGDWWFVVDHERGNPEYTIKIEVIYWE